MRPVLLFLLIGLTPVSALATEIKIPVGQQGQADFSLPVRGDAKIQVLQRFGLADLEHPAVGQPPIIRWDYRQFSVYFEDDRVISSVVHHQSATSLQRERQP